MNAKNKCPWCLGDPLYEKYHDEEWAVPVYDDQLLFEYLILEGAQAGLSWKTILHKRENYRKAFDSFNPSIIADYDSSKVTELLNNEGIVRNRLKINATINNAKMYLKVAEEYGSFRNYIWQFVNHETIYNQFDSMSQVPVNTDESDTMSKKLKQDGFKFVGSTICYAYMQAVGMVNDHLTTCFKSSNKN